MAVNIGNLVLGKSPVGRLWNRTEGTRPEEGVWSQPSLTNHQKKRRIKMTRNHLATTALERFLHSSPSRHLSNQRTFLKAQNCLARSS